MVVFYLCLFLLIAALTLSLFIHRWTDRTVNRSESASIPVHPRTNRPVGYAFVDVATAPEAQAAIAELSGKEILERKVSVQLARKPEPAELKGEGLEGEGDESRKRGGRRGRGRGRGGRLGRGGRVSFAYPQISRLCVSTGSLTNLAFPGNRMESRPTAPLKASPWTMSPTALLLKRNPVPANSVAHQKMALLPRPRSWWPTCPTILPRRR